MHTLNRGIIFVDEMALDQLDGEARFTDTSSADHNQLVLPEELEMGMTGQLNAFITIKMASGDGIGPAADDGAERR